MTVRLSFCPDARLSLHQKVADLKKPAMQRRSESATLGVYGETYQGHLAIFARAVRIVVTTWRSFAHTHTRTTVHARARKARISTQRRQNLTKATTVSKTNPQTPQQQPPPHATMAEEEEIAALVIDNGSGMCKGMYAATDR